VAPRKGAELAKQFIEETIGKHRVPAGQLTIHADRAKKAFHTFTDTTHYVLEYAREHDRDAASNDRTSLTTTLSRSKIYSGLTSRFTL